MTIGFLCNPMHFTHLKTLFCEKIHRLHMIVKGVYGAHTQVESSWSKGLGTWLGIHLVPFTILYCRYLCLSSLVSCEFLQSRNGILYFFESLVPRTGIGTQWNVIYRVSTVCKAQVPMGEAKEWRIQKRAMTFIQSIIHSFIELSNCYPIPAMWLALETTEKMRPKTLFSWSTHSANGKKRTLDFWRQTNGNEVTLSAESETWGKGSS